jgi:N-acetylmuramoyl-L-alanine amidase
MIGHIDEPSANLIINTTTFICRGWAYSECSITSIKIIIDEREVGVAEYGLPRNDVKMVFPQYSNIEKCGFIFSKNLLLVNGSHKLTVVVYDKEGTESNLGEVTFKRANKNIFKAHIPSVFTHLF